MSDLPYRRTVRKEYINGNFKDTELDNTIFGAESSMVKDFVGQQVVTSLGQCVSVGTITAARKMDFLREQPLPYEQVGGCYRVELIYVVTVETNAVTPEVALKLAREHNAALYLDKKFETKPKKVNRKQLHELFRK